jgi:hypothetical protein
VICSSIQKKSNTLLLSFLVVLCDFVWFWPLQTIVPLLIVRKKQRGKATTATEKERKREK